MGNPIEGLTEIETFNQGSTPIVGPVLLLPGHQGSPVVDTGGIGASLPSNCATLVLSEATTGCTWRRRMKNQYNNNDALIMPFRFVTLKYFSVHFRVFHFHCWELILSSNYYLVF